MRFSSQQFSEASGKLAGADFSHSRSAAFMPASFPPSRGIMRRAPTPSSQTSARRAASSSLLNAAYAAWKALPAESKLYYTADEFFNSANDRFDQPHHQNYYQAFIKNYITLSRFGLLSTFDLSQLFIPYDLLFARFRSLTCSLHYSGKYNFTMTFFTPLYMIPLEANSFLLFSYFKSPSSSRSRYRGAYPVCLPVGISGASGRDFTFNFLSSENADPYTFARFFFRLRFISPSLIQDDPFYAWYLYYTPIVKSFVDFQPF